MNEVEETLRVLEVQLNEYKSHAERYGVLYDEFSLKCEKVLKKDVYDHISTLLFKALKFYENKVEETSQARDDIIKKYNIPG